MTRLCSYQSKIHGDWLTVYRLDFPLSEILTPPDGWAFHRVNQHRKNCPDVCWRAIYGRSKQEPKP